MCWKRSIPRDDKGTGKNNPWRTRLGLLDTNTVPADIPHTTRTSSLVDKQNPQQQQNDESTSDSPGKRKHVNKSSIQNDSNQENQTESKWELAFKTKTGTWSAYLQCMENFRFKSSFAALPKLLQDYFVWHRDQTRNAKAISKESEAKYLVISYVGNDKCGGFSDRLHVLSFYLFMASSRLDRVLCITGLEHLDFLVPSTAPQWYILEASCRFWCNDQ